MSGVISVRLVRTLRQRLCLSQEEFAREAKVSKQTVWRVERGESINPASARALCTYLKHSPEELGLCVRGVHWPFSEGAGEHDEMKRRELLTLINVAGATLGLPALHELDWSRLAAVTTGRARVDTTTLRDYAALNRSLWQAFWASVRPSELLGPVQEQLHGVVCLREGIRTGAHQRHLYALQAEIGQLAGAILCNEGQDADAANCLTFAATSAREAEDYDLWASALIWHAFIPLFDERPDQALPLLQAATQLAQRGDSSLATRYAVAAYSADAYAGVGDLSARERVLEEAEGRAKLSDGTGTRAWITLDRQHLLEERGASAVTAGQPKVALPALEAALNYWPTQSRHRALIMTDLVRAAIELREIEQACAYGQELVGLTQQCSGLYRKSLRVLNDELSLFGDVPMVRDLRQQIRPVA